jgi:hypothetical protein
MALSGWPVAGCQAIAGPKPAQTSHGAHTVSSCQLSATAGQGFVIRSLVRAGREERVAVQVALRARLCDGM